MLKRVQHDNLISSPLKGEEKKEAAVEEKEKKEADGAGIKGRGENQ